MRKKQIIISIPKYIKGKKTSIKIPKEVPLKNRKRINFALISKDQGFPVRLKYGINSWIIHEGHDYTINYSKRLFNTSSDLFSNDKKLLIEWGKIVVVKCSNNHTILDFQNFCGECGEKI